VCEVALIMPTNLPGHGHEILSYVIQLFFGVI
jgi:hypothetical protein